MTISIAIDTKAVDDVVRKFKFLRKGVQQDFEANKTPMIGEEIVSLAKGKAPS